MVIVSCVSTLLIASGYTARTQVSGSRLDARRSGQTKGQAVVQSAVPVVPASPAPPETPKPSHDEAQIIKDTRAYEETLRDLAEKAEQVVRNMPDKPDELAKNFGDLREILASARTNLLSILGRKSEIDAQAETVLRSAAEVRQSFKDLAKTI